MKDRQPVWEGRAAAYTENMHSTSPVATINFCPPFFKLSTCDDAIKRWGKSSSPQNKLDLFNDQFQGKLTPTRRISIMLVMHF